jgi:nucleoside-diphosphate-sugar epimerase
MMELTIKERVIQMTKVFVAGATGRVGQATVRELVQKGVSVLAAGRQLDRIISDDLVTPVLFSFTWSVDRMKDELKGVDAIIFTAGSRGKDLLQVDLNGAVKLMNAAKKAGVKRFVMLSSAYSLDQEMWQKVDSLRKLTDYNIAKFFADRWLIDESGLDYTIVQAGVLTDDLPTGKIDVNPDQAGTNTVKDVAKTLVAALDQAKTVKKVLMIKNGSHSIEKALQSL